MCILNFGNCLKNHIADNKQVIPLKRIVFGAPIKLANDPAIRLPKGAVPINAITYKLIILPRLSSSTIVCIRVFDEAIVIIIPKPAKIISGSENNNEVENEKSISPMEKIVPAIDIHLPKPRTVFLAAKYIAPVNAPIPTAPRRYPKVFAFPWRISLAKTGMSTV